ncbi:hypothetical protein LG201_12515 [Methylobacillus gramineus]|uniref:hypothetical protein n=1 Tax=Methylobacillus gramineus TaxID=755169 RepID=UPI001CFFA027|nr:hypothetical protein [Methylobacillus gramineus]MCB5186029.1 hypothetical protein [Methylobacillus gramineus]
MSPSWLEPWRPGRMGLSITLAIYPDRIVWLRTRRGFKVQVQDKGLLEIGAVDGTWQPVLEQLPDVLKQAGASGLPVRVLMSNHFMRYAIVPNPDAAISREERDSLCRHAFERVHGAVVSGWELRLSLAAIGGSALASAMDRELLQILRLHLQAINARLLSVQPYLMAAYNHSTGLEDDGILALVEPQRLCLLAWRAGSWVAVQQQHLGADWSALLQSQVARLRMQFELTADTSLQVCALESASTAGLLVGPHRTLVQPAWPAGLQASLGHDYFGAALVL